MEGYGQTESTAAGTIGIAEDITNGHVGGPTVFMSITIELHRIQDKGSSGDGIFDNGQKLKR